MNDQTASIDLTHLKPKQWKVWWYDPRTGFPKDAGRVEGGKIQKFRSPPYGPDWVLVLDDASVSFPLPGLAKLTD
jgi:hypothetical protein